MSWKHANRSNAAIYQWHIQNGIVTLSSHQEAAINDFGAIKQVAFPADCRGKRLSFQAELSTENADGAGLWLTASSNDWHITDGMYDRQICGSSDWKLIKLVIDVPEDTMYVMLRTLDEGKRCLQKSEIIVLSPSIRRCQYRPTKSGTASLSTDG